MWPARVPSSRRGFDHIFFLFSFVIGVEGEQRPSDRCLPTEGRPVLKRPIMKTIMIEQSNWYSHLLLSSIMQILLEEHLGYEVVMNNNKNGFGRFRRASLVKGDIIPEDGQALYDYVRRGMTFAYMNPEAWVRDEWVDQKKYSIETGKVINVGGIGYDGEEGLFVPHWLSQPPYQGTFYFSYQGNDTRLASTVGQSAAVRINCSSSRREVCTGRRPVAENCTTYCPLELYGTDSAHLPPIPIVSLKDYAVGFLEQIVENNNFFAAVEWYPPEGYEAMVRSLVETPFAFYYWEPSILASVGDFSRVFLPNQRCGHNHHSEHSIGTWKCDLPTQMIIKICSANLRESAPPAWQFLSKLEMSERIDRSNTSIEDLGGSSITELLAAVEMLAAREPDIAIDENIRRIACRWVRDNEFQGSEWINWVKHDVPWWAETQPSKLIPTAAMMVLAIICVVLVHEIYIVKSHIFEGFTRSISAVRHCRELYFNLCGPLRPKPKAKSTASESDSTICRQRSTSSECDRSMVVDAEPLTATFDSLASFVQPEWVTLQDSGYLTVQLEREGNTTARAVVRLYTEDLDARAGVDYEGVNVECVFEPGQSLVSAEVPIIYSPTWENGKTFLLCLAPASDSIGLGRLSKANVHIIETDDFPGLGLGADSSPQLMMRRWLCFLMRSNKRRTVLAILIHVYRAFHHTVVMTVVPQLVVDAVLTSHQSPYFMVMSTTPILLVSLLIVRLTQRSLLDYNMVGPTEKLLRDHLFRKFWKLPMEVHFREQFRASSWLCAFLRVSESLFAWAGFFTFAEHFATLVFGSIVTLWLITDFFTTMNADVLIGLAVCCMVPLISLCLVMYCGPSAHYQAKLKHCERSFDTLVAQVMWVQRNWPIVHESHPMLPGMRLLASRFSDVNQEFQNSKKFQKLAGDSADWVSVYVSSIATFLLITFGGFILIERQYYGQGHITVGSYFALIKVFTSFGIAVKKLVQAVNFASLASATFGCIAKLLNIEEKQVTEHRQDTSSIKLECVSFHYQETGPFALKGISVCIPSDSAVALHGPPGVGKMTLLRLLGGMISPTTGETILPRAAKVAFLEGSGTFVPGTTVVDNISLGAENRTAECIDVLMRALGLADYDPPVNMTSCLSGTERTATLLGYEGQSPLNAGSATMNLKLEECMHFGSDRTGSIKDHTTYRQQLLVQLARALLTDPSLLFLNFCNLPLDSGTERTFNVLHLWRNCRNMDVFIEALGGTMPDGVWATGKSDRLLAEAAERAVASKSKGQTAKTFVVILPEACIQANPRWLQNIFTATLHLTSRTSCVFSPLSAGPRAKQYAFV